MSDNTEKVNQTIKQSFMYNFLEWVRAYIRDCLLLMMDFINWLSVSKASELFFVYPFTLFDILAHLYILRMFLFTLLLGAIFYR